MENETLIIDKKFQSFFSLPSMATSEASIRIDEPLIDIELPLPMSVNDIYVNTTNICISKSGKRYSKRIKTREAKDYGRTVYFLLRKKYKGGPLLPLNTPFKIYLEWHKSELFTYDWDNGIKLLQDSIFKSANEKGCHNDAWIVSAEVKKFKCEPKKEKCVVKLYLN